MLDERRLVPLRRDTPLVEGRVLRRRYVAIEARLLQAVALAQRLPVEVWPSFRFAERGVVGHGLRAELRHEANEARQRRTQLGQVAFLAPVPAEVEVTVGSVELRRVREHARVGDDGSRPVGLFERALDRAIEDRLVPGRKDLACHRGREWHRLVVTAPDRDGWVMTE